MPHRFASALLPTLFVVIACAGCGKQDDPVSPGTSRFTYGPVTEYQVSSAGAFTVDDSISGARISFPNGGMGTLRVARMLGVPAEVPVEGRGFQITFDGAEDFSLLLPRDGGIEPMLWYWSDLVFSHSGAGTVEGVWQPILPVDTSSSPAEFRILAFDRPGPSVAGRGVGTVSKTAKMRRVEIWNGYFQKHSTHNTRWVGLNKLTKNCISTLVAQMSSSLQIVVDNEMNGRMKSSVKQTWVSSHSYYHPYTFLSDLTAATRVLDPYICYNVMNATANTAAHEVGHYISHVILGDEAFYTMSLQAEKVHNIGSERRGRHMLEEYAFWSEHLLFGGVSDNANTSMLDPVRSLRFKNTEAEMPTAYDFPRKEGFGCALLARLTAADGVIASLRNTAGNFSLKDTVPTLRLSPATVYDMLRRDKVTTVDDLYRSVSGLLGPDDMKRFQVAAARIGWSYHGTVQVVDKSGNPLAGAEVKNALKISENQFWTNPANGLTDANGIGRLPCIFPGTSMLVVSYNYDETQKRFKDSVQVEIHTDFTKPTTTTLTLDRIVIGLDTLEVMASNQCAVSFSAEFLVSGTYPSGQHPGFPGISTNGRWTLRSVSWNGRTFSCSYNDTENGKLDMLGSVSSDGRTLTTLTASMSLSWENTQMGSHGETSASIELRNVPFVRKPFEGTFEFEARGATAKTHVTSMRFTIKEYDGSGTTVYDCESTDANWNSSGTVPWLLVQFSKE